MKGESGKSNFSPVGGSFSKTKKSRIASPPSESEEFYSPTGELIPTEADFYPPLPTNYSNYNEYVKGLENWHENLIKQLADQTLNSEEPLPIISVSEAFEIDQAISNSEASTRSNLDWASITDHLEYLPRNLSAKIQKILKTEQDAKTRFARLNRETEDVSSLPDSEYYEIFTESNEFNFSKREPLDDADYVLSEKSQVHQRLIGSEIRWRNRFGYSDFVKFRNDFLVVRSSNGQLVPVFENWKNLICSGGAIFGSVCLQDYKPNDYDIFFYGLTAQEANRRLEKILKRFLTLELTRQFFHRTSDSIRVFLNDGKVIRFNLQLYSNPYEILINSVVDAQAIAFDGSELIYSNRFWEAVNNRRLIYNPENQREDYEEKLFKYMLRGFRVHIPGYNRNIPFVPRAVYGRLPGDERLGVSEKLLLAKELKGVAQLILLDHVAEERTPIVRKDNDIVRIFQNFLSERSTVKLFPFSFSHSVGEIIYGIIDKGDLRNYFPDQKQFVSLFETDVRSGIQWRYVSEVTRVESPFADFNHYLLQANVRDSQPYNITRLGLPIQYQGRFISYEEALKLAPAGNNDVEQDNVPPPRPVGETVVKISKKSVSSEDDTKSENSSGARSKKSVGFRDEEQIHFIPGRTINQSPKSRKSPPKKTHSKKDDRSRKEDRSKKEDRSRKDESSSSEEESPKKVQTLPRRSPPKKTYSKKDDRSRKEDRSRKDESSSSSDSPPMRPVKRKEDRSKKEDKSHKDDRSKKEDRSRKEDSSSSEEPPKKLVKKSTKKPIRKEDSSSSSSEEPPKKSTKKRKSDYHSPDQDLVRSIIQSVYKKMKHRK